MCSFSINDYARGGWRSDDKKSRSLDWSKAFTEQALYVELLMRALLGTPCALTALIQEASKELGIRDSSVLLILSI